MNEAPLLEMDSKCGSASRIVSSWARSLGPHSSESGELGEDARSHRPTLRPQADSRISTTSYRQTM
jgi:hypothetical protein